MPKYIVTKQVNTNITRRFTVEAETGELAVQKVASGEVKDEAGEIVAEGGGVNYQKQLVPLAAAAHQPPRTS